jgi:hypothetical protein
MPALRARTRRPVRRAAPEWLPKVIDRQGFLSAVTVLPETFQNAAKLEYILP